MESNLILSRPEQTALPTVTVNSYEIVAIFESSSTPGKTYETVLNRYTGRATCDCPGFTRRSVKTCKHCEALIGFAETQGLMIKNRKGTRREARPVIADFDPYTAYDIDNDDPQVNRMIDNFEAQLSAIRGSDLPLFLAEAF